MGEIVNLHAAGVVASERLITEMQQVARLHSRFQVEFKRQAAEAVAHVKQPSAPARPTAAVRAQPRSRPTPAPTGALEPSPASTAGGKKKKKKRSALANASNPHHLRNYVPSRLPNTGPPNAAQDAQSLISPLPLRFLNADLPTRSRRRPDDALASVSDTAPPPTATSGDATTDEWICPFCEYNLFYGDERAFQNALRSRKKVLRRRRRARERAAAAASGKPLAPKPAPAPGRAQEEEEDALFDPPHDDVPASITSQVKWNSRGARESDQRGVGSAG
jgi:hypothetical protein